MTKIKRLALYDAATQTPEKSGQKANSVVLRVRAAANSERGADKVRAAAKAAPAPARFSESDFQAEVRELVRKKQTDKATRALIEALPPMYDSKLNVKEKMNNLLFLARAIQEGGGSKYGHVKLRSKIKTLASFVKDYPLPKGGFIELGCGAHDPISMSVYFYLNGLVPACGVDLLPPRADYFSAVSMYDILANVKMFPGRYVWGGRKPHEVLTELRTVNVAKFERGDFWGGLESLEGKVRLINDDILQCDLDPGSIALLTSFAVLEHVTDIDAIFARCFELMAPGGIAYHFVDLADHRSYRGDGQFGPLSFLTEDVAPANMNRLRAPQVAAAASAAGFELLSDQRVTTEMNAATRAALVSPFDAMSPTDISVIKQHLVLRKPV